MADKAYNFESALKELEDITRWFESSDAGLDQGLVKFERGMELANQLKNHLTSVENRVEKIKQRFSAAPAAAAASEAPAAAAASETPAAAPTPTGQPSESDEQADLFG